MSVTNDYTRSVDELLMQTNVPNYPKIYSMFDLQPKKTWDLCETLPELIRFSPLFQPSKKAFEWPENSYGLESALESEL